MMKSPSANVSSLVSLGETITLSRVDLLAKSSSKNLNTVLGYQNPIHTTDTERDISSVMLSTVRLSGYATFRTTVCDVFLKVIRKQTMSKEMLMNGDTTDIVLARLEATGLKTVTAFSSSYDDTFPDALDGIISRKEFKFCIDVINQTLEDYYPCAPCYACGYFCCVFTLGVSILMPEPCTKDLETNVEVVMKRINNREEFLYRGIIWKLHRSPRTHSSWIEISQLLYE